MTDISTIAASLTPKMREALETHDDGLHHPVTEEDQLMVCSLHGAKLADFNSLNGMPSSWWLSSTGLAVREALLEGKG